MTADYADYLVRGMTTDGLLRASVAVTSGVTGEVCRLQGTDPTASVALGRLLAAAALCGSLLKGDQRLALAVEGNGPVGRIQAETDAAGHLRASIKQPVAGLLPKDGGYDVAGAVGRAGFLHVVKDLGLKEPYRGMVQLVNSEIGSDLAYYFSHSEQIPTSVGVGVTLGADGGVAAAGGFLVQAMPGCSDELLVELEGRLLALPPVSTMLQQESPESILGHILTGISHAINHRQPLSFRCSCNLRQVGELLRVLGDEELARLAARGEETVVTCEYCRRQYRFTPSELGEIGAARSDGDGAATVH